VFLHGDSKEEYALARTERKTGRGYHGFAFHAEPSVTVEQDLERRDLTINAIAQHEDGRLVDPYGGVADIEARVLRHVSAAFVEDPVRVLRVARFAARYAPLGFRVADDTMALMRRMVDDGEVDHLMPERVWAETRKALAEPMPDVFVRVLRECGALAVLFPEVDALYGVPQRPEFHPEVDTGIHIEMVLRAAATVAPGDALVGYCALTHDLGKALTPADVLPRHIMHEQRGVKPVQAMSARLKVPAEYAFMAEMVCKHHLNAHMAFELKATTVLRLLESLGALRRPERLETFLLACIADKRGRLHHEDDAYPQADYLRACRAAAAAVTSEPFTARGLQGPAIGEAMKKAQAEAIAKVPA
jgi:tRNA nucleotidyltransferase/poly(A) polymerase